jgi:hypothetical protein
MLLTSKRFFSLTNKTGKTKQNRTKQKQTTNKINRLRTPQKTNVMSPRSSQQQPTNRIKQQLSNIIEATLLPAMRNSLVANEKIRTEGILTKLEAKLLVYQCE